MSHFPGAVFRNPTGQIDMEGERIINLADPGDFTDAANKGTVGNANPGSVGGSAVFAVPDPDDFTWVNQGSSTYTFVDGVICLAAPSSAGATNIRALVTPLPAAPYTVTAAIRALGGFDGTMNAGIVYWDSVSGKMITFGYWSNGTTQSLAAFKYTNPTTWNSQYATLAPTRFFGPGHPWFRWVDNSTNRIWYMSQNGVHFAQCLSHSRTDHMTPTHVGFFAGPENAMVCHVDLVSWKVTGTVGQRRRTTKTAKRRTSPG